MATVPEFDGCSALGATPAQALEEVLVVAALWDETDSAHAASDPHEHVPPGP